MAEWREGENGRKKRMEGRREWREGENGRKADEERRMRNERKCCVNF